MQEENPKEKLWKSLNESGFYTKTYKEFDEQFSTSEKISALYKNLNQNEYYTKSEEEFNNQFFSPVGKPNEVSTQGSENTSETSTEPLPASQEFDEFGLPIEKVVDESYNDRLSEIVAESAKESEILSQPKAISIDTVAGEPDGKRDKAISYGDWLTRWQTTSLVSPSNDYVLNSDGWDLPAIYDFQTKVGNNNVLSDSQLVEGTKPSNPLFSTKSIYYNGKGEDDYVGKWSKDGAKDVLQIGTYNKDTNGLKKIIDAFRTVYPEDTLLDNDRKVIYADGKVTADYENIDLYGDSGEVDFKTSVNNTVKNIGNRLSGFDDRLNVLAADTWENILGKELANDWYQWEGRDIDKVREDAYAELARLKEEVGVTQDLAVSLRDGNVVNIGSSIIDLMGSVVSSLPLTVAGGAPMVLDFAGDYITQHNAEKAALMGTSVMDLYQKGNNDYVAPAMLGIIGGLAENIGMRGVKTMILDGLKTKGGLTLSKMLLTSQKEGVTELWQSATEDANLEAAKPNSTPESIADAFAAGLFSDKGLKSYLYGAVATLGIGGSGKILKGIGSSNQLAKQGIEKMAALFQDRNKLAENSPERAAVEKVIEETANDVIRNIDKTLVEEKVLEKLPLSQKVKLNNIQNEIAETEAAANNEGISKETKEQLEQKSAELQNQADAIAGQTTFTYESLDGIPESLKSLAIPTFKDGKAVYQLVMPKAEADALQQRIREGKEPDMELKTPDAVVEGKVIEEAPVEKSEPVVEEKVPSKFIKVLEQSEEVISQRKEKALQNFKNSLKTLNSGFNPETAGHLLEYTFLALADGTVKTAKALAKALDTPLNEDVQAIFDKAVAMYTTYKESIVTTPKTTVKQTIKATTNGGTTGTVNLTTKQAFKAQYTTLNQGIREGLRQARVNLKERTDFVKTVRADLKDAIKNFPKMLDGKAVPKQVTTRLLNILNKAGDNVDRLEDFADIMEKTADDLNYTVKLDKARGLTTKLKRLAKGKALPFDLKNQLRALGNINPNYIQDVDGLVTVLQDISKFATSPTLQFKKGNDFIQQNEQAAEIARLFNEYKKYSDEYNAKKIERIDAKLTAMGIDTTTVKAIYANDLVKTVEALQGILTASSNNVKKVEQMREAAKIYHNLLNTEVDEDLFTERGKQDFQKIKSLDLDQVPENKIAAVVASLANLVNNNSLAGSKDLIVQSMIQENTANAKLMQTVKDNIRHNGEFFNKLVGYWGSGSARIASLLKNNLAVGALNAVTGLTDLKISTQRVLNYKRGLDLELKALYKKYEKDFSKPIDNMLLGIFRDIRNTEADWTQERIDAEPLLRLEAFVNSLDRIKMNTVKDKNYEKTNREYIKNYEQALDKVVTVTRDANGAVESVKMKGGLKSLYNSLPEGHKKFSDMADRRYEETKENLLYNSAVMNNIDLGSPILNYSPRMYQTVISSDETVNLGASAKTVGASFQTSSKGQVSGSGKSRLLSGSELPANLVLDPDFVGRFKGELLKAVYDSETQKYRMYAEEATKESTSPFIQLLDNKQPFLDYRNIMELKIANDIFALGNDNLDVSAIKRVWGYLQRTGVAIGLGGVGQFVKQAPPLIDVAIRLKNTGALATALKAYVSDTTGDVEKLLQYANVSNRSAVDMISKPTSVKQRAIDTSTVSGLLRKAGLTAEQVTEVLADKSLFLLQWTDKKVADIGWLAFYMDYQKQNGQAVTLDGDNLNREAFDYADTMTSLSMNESDRSMVSRMSGNSYVKYTMPFISFAINAKIDLAINLAKVVDPNVKGADKVKALKDFAGNMSAVATFMGISSGIRIMATGGATAAMISIINSGDEPEEEKERLRKLVNDTATADQRKNAIRTIGYATTEVLTGGIATQILGDAIEPVAEAVENQFYDEKEVKEANKKAQTSTALQLLGTAGITINKALEFGKDIKDATQTDADFMKSVYGELDASGKEIVLNKYRLDPNNIQNYAKPLFAKQIDRASAVLSGAALLGFSLQESNTFKRKLQKYERLVVESTRGKQSKQTLNDLVKAYKEVRSVKIGSQEIRLTEQQISKFMQYREEAVKKLKKMEVLKSKFTQEEYAKFIRKESTTIANDRLAVELFKANAKDGKTSTIKEQKEEERKKMINYNRK